MSFQTGHFTIETSAGLPVAVLVVDDQFAVREGLARLIASAPIALRGVATAANGTEALSIAAQLRPEVVVLDVDLAGEDGLALIKQFPAGTSVLVLTCHGETQTRERAMRLGAHAFVEKHQPAADVLDAIVRMATPQPRGEQTPATQGAGSPTGAVESSVALAPRGF